MKRAKRTARPVPKPRNPFAANPLLAKGGAHQRRDKRASRARQKQALLRSVTEQ